MKQTTKVLLPLGLFMSIVIPITVKSLFTETDFFKSDETSKIDFLQPYKIKPETVTDLPRISAGEDGGMEVIEQVPSKQPREPQQSERGSRDRKLNMPSSLTPSDESESISELPISTVDTGY